MTAVSARPGSSAQAYREAYDASARVRPLYRSLLEALRQVDLAAVKRAADGHLEAAGAKFGAEPFRVCPIPRLVGSEEWDALAAGLAQRALALSLFVADVYGARTIIEAGFVPAEVIEAAEGYESELRGAWPGGPVPLPVLGLDVVRDRDGELLVLEDNARTPSGYSYAVMAREAVVGALGASAPAVLDAMPAPLPLHRPFVAALRATLQDAAAAVGGDGHSPHDVVVLTDGPTSAAFFEHRWVAGRLDAPLVTVDELESRNRELWWRPRDSRRARRVKAVYRRTETDGLRDGQGGLTPVAERLLEPWLAGRLAIVNPFGTGVADDKLVHAHVESMIRFYLGQEPLLPSVRTLDLNDPDALAAVIGDLRGYVVKPRHGQGGHGVVVCAHASDPDIRRLGVQLRRPDAGATYVAQPMVELSTHPTVIGDRLVERHVDLRPFTFAARDEIAVVPGGLTRVAWNAGALVVNSSQDGGAKDTWVLP